MLLIYTHTHTQTHTYKIYIIYIYLNLKALESSLTAAWVTARPTAICTCWGTCTPPCARLLTKQLQLQGLFVNNFLKAKWGKRAQANWFL